MSAPSPSSSGRNTESPAPLRLSAGDDAIRSWLSVLGSMLKLPEAQASSIRDELESHLRLRVRDLMIEGHSEPRAVGLAIEELGDAASLAQRYREAFEHPRRRKVMHSALLLATGAAISVGTFAVLRTPQPPVSQPQVAQNSVAHTGEKPASAAESRAIAKAPAPQVALPARQEIAAGATAKTIVSAILGSMESPPDVRWSQIKAAGLDPDAKSARPFAWSDPKDALRTLSTAFDLPPDKPVRLAMYDFPELRFVSTQEEVEADSRMETRTLDVTSLLTKAGNDQKIGLLVQVVQSAISPSVWESRGGDCTMTSFGSMVVVRARPQLLREITNVLVELDSKLTRGFEQRMRMIADATSPQRPTVIDLTKAAESRKLQFAFAPASLGQGVIECEGLDAKVTAQAVQIQLPAGARFLAVGDAENQSFGFMNTILGPAGNRAEIGVGDSQRGTIYVSVRNERIYVPKFAIEVPASSSQAPAPAAPAR